MDSKIKSDGGGGANYYDLPKGASQLQDLIEHRNMNGNIKDIFKACFRLGVKEGTTEDYDMRKIVYYALRELGRVDGRKDYLTLAEEVIGHQHEAIDIEIIEATDSTMQYRHLIPRLSKQSQNIEDMVGRIKDCEFEGYDRDTEEILIIYKSDVLRFSCYADFYTWGYIK